ncbi:MAG: EamA family transporter [Clostridia bacterium]|nr:EamA family transporter [Clostridia bacterium]
MYYGLISLSALLFSMVFIFSDKYTKQYGPGTDAAIKFTAGSHFAGLVALLIINRFRVEFTPFTAAVALTAAVDIVLFNVCSLRALGRTNLSKYSVFSMTGGMALPFASGILFFNEDMTLGKGLCLALVLAALALTVEKGEKKGGALYYAGVFITNGLYGVINKYFSFSAMNKTSDAAYSALIEAFTVLLCLALLAFTKDKIGLVKGRGLVYMGGYGVMCAVGNYLLLIALSVLPASSQYPFVTGGVMIISTLYSFFTPEKPGKKQLASVALALLGIVLLVTL